MIHLSHRVLRSLSPCPRTAVERLIPLRMNAQTRRERCKLRPAYIHLRISLSYKSARIMSPIKAERVRGSLIEFHFKSKDVPCAPRIARKPHRVLVIAESAPAAERQTALSAVFGMLIVAIIEPRQMAHFIKSLYVWLYLVLLPVEPPEIDALSLYMRMHAVEKSGHITLISRIEFEIYPGFRRNAYRAHKIGI